MSGFADVHEELRAVARDQLGASGAGTTLAWPAVVSSGWTGLEVPEALDGAGATFAEVAIVLEEMGRAASAGPYLGAVALTVGALQLLEPGAGRDELLRAIAGGAAVAALALPGDIDAIGTVDRVDGNLEPSPVPFQVVRGASGGRVEGRAAFVPDATEADRLLLPALDHGRPVLVSVDATQPGIVVDPRPVVDATRRLADVIATGIEVDERSVWPFADAPTPPLCRLGSRAAVAVACDCLGVIAAMVDATVAYASDRRQFGRPIGSFQAVKHACADMAVQLAIARELVAMAITDLAASGDAGDHHEATSASMAASYAGDAGVAVAGKAVQLHGGIGYTWESDVHVYLKRATLNRSLFGAPSTHRRRLGARHAPPR